MNDFSKNDEGLISSNIDRQNILNNPFALKQLEVTLGLGGHLYENNLVFTKSELSEIFNIEERTIERYLTNHRQELIQNGYEVLEGKKLNDFKNYFGTDINVGTKTTVLGIFKFKTVLNLAMLLTESGKAKFIRSQMLDIVISVLAEKSGGTTKYINQRDEDYLYASFQEENYRKNFTDAVDKYLAMPDWKYGYTTNCIYKAIFLENAEEYRKILDLKKKESVRDTMYAEVLTLIASFEAGLAYEIKEAAERKESKKLSKGEFDEILAKFSEHPSQKPLLNDVRTKMASRDKCFRDALHYKLEHYISSVPEADFEKFLGEKSRSLEERIKESKEVFKRLKDN